VLEILDGFGQELEAAVEGCDRFELVGLECEDHGGGGGGGFGF
jgi:hypothetical protein